ncbi:MAG: LuxR family transcriptional regulator, maltose regulon positive regulatory protein [Pseudonocardiales bacterium]|nr:LuxR family transcriptional regulator, maltose regulon positive regulatory protein [Pseudonocardiales bacterium]
MVASTHARLIDRDHLLVALDRTSAVTVTVVSAPAGSGKTSLLRTWARRVAQARGIADVQVRRDRPDAQLFWLELLNAIRRASTTAGTTEPAVATPAFNEGTIVDRVLGELAEYPGLLTLVVDDLHELDSSATLAQLTRLLTSLPPHVNAVLATRRDLRLRLQRLRLAGELAEIRADDLRFTEPETRELLDASGIRLSDAGVALLHKRTEGWAAGLRLAAISLTGHPDPDRFVAEFSGSNRTVAEYLIAEMLDRQPLEVQELLLRTSLPDRVNGELADVLSDRSDSERILLELEDANAFVSSLDPGRTWFRYHHLFADLLRLELRRCHPEELPALHRKAAGWFAKHGQFLDAIRHLQAAGDWHDAARLLADRSLSLSLDGQERSIEALLDAFPAGACANDPELALVRAGSAMVRGRLDQAGALLAVAKTHVETTETERRSRLRVAIALLKVSVARRRGHLAGVTEQLAFLASPSTGKTDQDFALSSELRAVTLLNLGAVEGWAGLHEAERHLLQGAGLARQIGRPYVEVSCLAFLGYASTTRSFTTVRQRCHEAIELAERYGWGAESFISPALVTLAYTMIWMGEFDEGERWLRRAKETLQSDAAPAIGLSVHLVAGMLHAARRFTYGALEEFSSAQRLQSELTATHRVTSQVTGWLAATQARLGMVEAARTTLETITDERADWGEINNACAVIHLAENCPKEALGALQAVLAGTAPVIHDFTVVEAHLLAARASLELGDQRAAHDATESALALAEADRLVLPFAMTASGDLLEAIRRHETAHAALLIDIRDVLRGAALTTKDVPPSPPTEKLSPSELRVLRYLPTNLSRPQIAGELSVSVNTVNTQVRSIYAKLQASDRSSAVQRARDLRLLSPGTR